MFGGLVQITESDAYEESSLAYHQLGSIALDQYGDMYRYTQVGAVALTAGQIQQAPTQKTNHHNRAASAAVAGGGTAVTVTLGATAAVANEYAQGYLVANDVSPEGETYRIIKHPAANASATLEVTVDRPFKTAITTSSEFTLVHNNWNGVLVGSAVTIRAAGIPLVDMTIAYYGWLKTRGVTAALIGSAGTLGADLIVSAATPGALTDRTDSLGASAEPVVAVADIVLGVTGEYNPVRLVID